MRPSSSSSSYGVKVGCIAALLIVALPLRAQTPNGTYLLELTPVPGKEREWPPRTMRLVLSVDTVPFMNLREPPGRGLPAPGFPSNACVAVMGTGVPFHWAHKARWTPGRADTVRVWVHGAMGGGTEVRVAIDGDSVNGLEFHTSDVLPADRSPDATVHGRRVGDADPQWCAQMQNAYIRTNKDGDLQHHLVGALTPPP